MKRPATVLKDAAKVLEKRGWTQGSLENELGRMCLVGSINFAIDGNARRIDIKKMSLRNRALKCLLVVLPKKYQRLGEYYESDRSYYGATEYNDAPSRRRHQVINLLRKAAEKCDARS